MSANLFLAEIDFLGKTWYVSNEAFSGRNYYAPYITQSPNLEIGPSKGGYIGVRMGQLSLSNNPYDEFHPFSIFTGGYKSLIENPNQLIPTRLFWGERESPLFTGSISLDNLNSDEISFFIENEEYSNELLKLTRDVDAKTVSVTTESLSKDADNLVTVISPDHGLEDGDLVVVTSSSDPSFNTESSGKGSIIEKVNDSSFTYTAPNGGSTASTSTDHSVQSYLKRFGPFVFGKVNLRGPLIEIDNLDTDGKSIGSTYENPGVEPFDSNNHLQLFDDGVLVGTTDSSITSQVVGGSASIAKSANIVTVTFTSSHGLSVGEAIEVSGVTGDSADEYNTRQIITTVPSTTQIQFNVSEYANAPTGTPTVKTINNFFGDGRYPSVTRIRSRQEDTNQQSGTYSHNGTDLTISITDHEFKVGDAVKLNFSSGSRSGTSEIVTVKTRNEGTNGKGTSFVATSTESSGSGNVQTGTARGYEGVGQSAVSGISTNGSTVAEFFEMIKDKLHTADKPVTSVDFSRAPNCDTEQYGIWVMQQSLVIDFAGKIAENSNYHFTIDQGVLKLFDLRSTSSTFRTFRNDEVTDATYIMPYPIKAFETNFQINVPKTDKVPTAMVAETRTVRVENLFDGEVKKIENVTDDLEDAETFLKNIKEVKTKSATSITIGDVIVDVKIGDRIKTIREEDGLSIDMNVRSIKYNFDQLETKFEGDCTLSIIERETVN